MVHVPDEAPGRLSKKAELHCHLGGAFDPALLRVAIQRGYPVPIGPEESEALSPVRSYEAFVRWHATAAPVRSKFQLVTLALEFHLERLKARASSTQRL
jgi:hypothetical protein